MRFWIFLGIAGFSFMSFAMAKTHDGAGGDPSAQQASPQVEVTADQTLEWYQDKNMYVARGNAKAVRGDLTITADYLTAHQREQAAKPAKGSAPTIPPAPASSPADDKKNPDQSGGDIDKMTAEGHVLIVKPNMRITGDRAVDDMDKHITVVTGNNLKYETDKQVVTARDSLEYWDTLKLAVARGHAVAIKGDRHVEGDLLTAEFRDQPNGASQLYKMTALGNVVVITKGDVTKGDKGVYDAGRDIAIVTGHVRITRADGTELTGDVGESDFAANQSRLLNDGSGRVRALLPAKATSKATKTTQTTPITNAPPTAVTQP